uniref:Uncharacterized protein n=1 Tax=Anguilla anguilla TaxID=7936 RepID=A0A0E9WB69_ANGAN
MFQCFFLVNQIRELIKLFLSISMVRYQGCILFLIFHLEHKGHAYFLVK